MIGRRPYGQVHPYAAGRGRDEAQKRFTLEIPGVTNSSAALSSPASFLNRLNANQDQSNGITVALVVRPHGVRGEVACEILPTFRNASPVKSIELWDGASTARVAVRKCWLSHSSGGQAIFHFAASTPWTMRRSWSAEVQFPRRACQAPRGQLLHQRPDRLQGGRADRREVGVVKDVEVWGETIVGTPILEVTADDGLKLLIPLAQDICVNVDIAGA